MRHESKLSEQATEDTTAAAHLAVRARRGSVYAATELAGPESSEAITYLRGWFIELARTRGWSMTGPNPLTYENIESWARLTGRSPEPYEVEALLEIDAAVRIEAASKKKGASSST